MSRIRLLFAWLILAALPLQGFAAASMLFCGMDGAGHGRGTSVATEQPAHDHAAHSRVHAHAIKLTKDVHGSSHPSGAGHTCGVCAACCNSVAITQAAHLAPLVRMPQPHAAQPFALIHARAVSVPDRPPRA